MPLFKTSYFILYYFVFNFYVKIFSADDYRATIVDSMNTSNVPFPDRNFSEIVSLCPEI